MRSATIIVPDTGERVNRKFTLRDPQIFGHEHANGQPPSEQTPLVTGKQPSTPSWVQRSLATIQTLPVQVGHFLWDFITGRDGQGVLKCSFAYLLGTMAVFVPFFRNGFFLGPGDGKHLVANITIWFHPARSNGSMHYGTTLAFVFWFFSAIVAYGCMAVVVLFDNQELIEIGQAIIVIVACGGGLGLLVWIKQRVNDPLVNVSCTIAALPITAVVTKDPATQLGYFSSASVTTVLYMLIMAIIISTLVNAFIRPVFARTDLRDNLVKATTAYGTILAGITSGFLSGVEDDLTHPAVKSAEDNFNNAYGVLDSNLSEAKWEQYLLGTETRYEIEQRLVKCMQRLAQDIGGLRSAASIQFYLLKESAHKDTHILSSEPLASPSQSAGTPLLLKDFATANATRSDEFPPDLPDEQISQSPMMIGSPQEASFASRRLSTNKPDGPSAASADHIFTSFIDALGPPMVCYRDQFTQYVANGNRNHLPIHSTTF